MTQVNYDIRVKSVRLIDEEGNQLGIKDTKDAVSLSRERGLDCVLVAENSSPPVCKMMDYGKFKYEQSKREKRLAAQNKEKALKQIRLGKSLKIEDHDLNRKIRKVEKFLKKGHKVLVIQPYKGREIFQREEGVDRLNDIADQLSSISEIESDVSMGERRASMTLSPK